jgi:hypothetical protein
MVCSVSKRRSTITVHNHRGWGFSGVIYLEYDPNVHTPTFFVAPWQDPSTDTTKHISADRRGRR